MHLQMLNIDFGLQAAFAVPLGLVLPSQCSISSNPLVGVQGTLQILWQRSTSMHPRCCFAMTR